MRRLRPLAPLLAALLAATLVACSGRSPAPEAASDATPLVGIERRPARAAAAPGATLDVAIPAGARRAIVEVAAIREGRWPWGGHATVEVRGGVPVRATIPVRRAAEGSWTRLDVTLPPGATSLSLAASPGHAQRIWWSTIFEGVAPREARNILLISLDTVRADAVSCLGQRLPTTPNLDRLAARGTLFEQAITAAPWTLPSHVSVMTGVLPSWHGRTDPLRLDRDLPPLPTLASILAARGWDTAAFTGSGSISWALGATRGFSLVVEQEPTRANHWWRSEQAECVRSARTAVAWLEDREEHEAHAPFFLFWHTYEPHFPYQDGRYLGTQAPLPPGIAEDARADWLRYLGDIAQADAALGGLLDALDRLGLGPSTDIIVISDHGEEFGEHSGGRREEATRHGNGLWETVLRVPLVVVSPSIQPGRRAEQVSLLDVFPTVLACAGLDSPAAAQGHALQVPGGDDLVASEALYPKYVTAQQKSMREAAGLKYVATLGKPPSETLFDVTADPLELRSVASERAGDEERLRRALVDLFGAAPDATAVRGGRAAASGADLPPEVLESLKALGYVK